MSETPQHPPKGPLGRLRDYYRRHPGSLLMHHIALYVVVAALGITARLLGLAVPLFWPLGVWFLVLAGHFFFYRSFQADEDWADDRADRLRRHSYDFQHIREIYKEPTPIKTEDIRAGTKDKSDDPS